MYIPLEHSLSRVMNMQDINSLLDACKVAAGASSDNQLASALGVGRSAISNYRHARALPDPVVCATIAGLSGIPLARVLGIVGEARAISREEKAVWRKLAATAMALCLAVGFALPHKAQAAVTGFDKSTVYTLCEMMYRTTAAFVGSAWSRPNQKCYAAQRISATSLKTAPLSSK
jgi:transcriptional regulator with XRE-family HTH domain